MTYIISHHDADGIISAYLINKLQKEQAKIIFKHWAKFGIQEDSEELKQLTEPSDVYVCDLGCSTETISALYNLTGKMKNIYLIDHHPPEENIKLRIS